MTTRARWPVSLPCVWLACLVASGAVLLTSAAVEGQSLMAAVTPARPDVVLDDYVIGPDDVLSIIFWRNKEMSGDVVVRPDGRITLPLLNDLAASGLTPSQLRERIATDAAKFIEDPEPTVTVRQINSRRVYITGAVAKPGPYPLVAPLSVMQLIALAGGLNEWAHGKDIVVMRGVGATTPTALPFDYTAVMRGRHLEQNMPLRPGDTVVVP